MAEHLPYRVEPMALEDVGQVMVIEEVSFSAPWSARAYRYEITENEHSTMLVLRLALWHAGRLARWLRPNRAGGGPVLGYGGFWLLAEDAHISTLAVHPRWRGLGLGELLLLSLLEQGAALAAYRATLEVRVSNQVAQGLYHKVGFEIVSRRKRYYADNNEDAYIMATPPFETPAFQAAVRQCRVQLYARLRAQGVPEGEALTNAGQRTLDKKPQIR